MRYQELIREQRVDELVGVKKFANMTHLDIVKYLKDTFGEGRFRVLGDGTNAIALELNGVVYKFWLKDSAYEDFVRYAAKNQDNPLLPKIRSGIKELPAFFVRSNLAPDTIRYVKLEFLESCTDRSIRCTNESGIYRDMATLASGIHARLRITELTAQQIEDQFVEKFYDSDAVAAGKDGSQTLTPEFKNLIQTVWEITQLGDHLADYHDGNFLSRENGEVVIIDPIANESDISLNNQIDKFANTIKRRKSHPVKQASRRTT